MWVGVVLVLGHPRQVYPHRPTGRLGEPRVVETEIRSLPAPRIGGSDLGQRPVGCYRAGRASRHDPRRGLHIGLGQVQQLGHVAWSSTQWPRRATYAEATISR